MINIQITMKTTLEKYLELIQTLRALNKPTAKKTAYLQYAIYCKLEDKKSLILHGELKTREALKRHIMSYQFSVLLGTKALLCEPMGIQIITVSRSEGMEIVHSIREPKSN